jgi:single-strand DNA-binding protein
MAASYCKVFLLGNLTRDIELRYTPKGTPVADLGLAINRVFTDEQGTKKEEVTFIDVTLWGRTAEIGQQYLHKGSSVFIEGRAFKCLVLASPEPNNFQASLCR